MVLVTAAEEEQRHRRLVMACGDRCPDMEQSVHMNRTATSLMTSTSPSLSLSPCRQASGSERASPEDWISKATALKKSPVSDNGRPENYVSHLTIDSAGKISPFSYCSNSAMKEEETERESKQFVVNIKQEQELEAPLDFSIKRNDSQSDTFAKDYQTSRLAPFSSPSSRLSPDTSLQQHQPTLSHSYNGSSYEDTEDEVSKSPSPSQVKSAEGATHSAKGPTAASLAALGLLSDGSGAGMSPAVLSAVLGQNGAVAGALSGVQGLMGDAHKLQSAGGGKAQRPFKAYPKEVLKMPLGYLGLPGVSPFPGIDPSYVQSLQGIAVLPEQLMTMYKQQTELLKEREKQTKNTNKKGSKSPPSSALSPLSSNSRNHLMHTSPSPPLSSTSASHSQTMPSSIAGTHTDSCSPGLSAGSGSPASLSQAHSPPLLGSGPGTESAPSALSASTAPLVSSTSSTSGGSRKRPRNFPDAEKDDAYWERRRKNNDAAKRSRDARRAKEDEIAIRAALLEQENLRLRVEVAALKTETARLRCLLYKA